MSSGQFSFAAYLLAHWRGQQSLFWSFWINLLAVRVLVFNIQDLLAPAEDQDYSGHALLVIAGLIVVHGLLLLWQLVGVVRAVESDFSRRGNLALVWAAQLGATVLFLLTAVYALGVVQWMQVSPVEPDPLTRMAREHASRYQLLIDPSGTLLSIEGSIETGISRAVSSQLQQNPRLRRVTLESRGGNVYEGRALARLFTQYQLDTRVEGVCASACTTAYAGGISRSAAPGAELGFHQYRLEASYAIIGVEIGDEQERDAELFISAGVSPEFVNKLFNSLPTDMWWPSLEELLEAGLVQEISG